MSTATDDPNDPRADERVAVGRIGPAHGVRGAVFVEPWTDAPDERFAAGATLQTEPAAVGPLAVVDARYVSNRLVVRFDAVDDRAAAEGLRGVTLFVAATDRPALHDPDEYYDTDLIGLAARSVDGAELGPVRDVLHAGGADYLVLEVDGRERLVPFVAAIVPTIDIESRQVVVDAPEGLFDL